VTPDGLAARGEALHAALGREYYLTGAGLKPDPEFQAIYQRYADLIDDEAVTVARASGVPALFEWAVDLRVGRAVAPLEEAQLRWEQAAMVEVDRRRIPYLRVPIELQNAPDRAFRVALDAARARAGRDGLAVDRARRFTVERETVLAAAPAADYVAAVGRMSGVDLDALGQAAGALLEGTDALYGDALARLSRARLGRPPRDLVRADAAWLFRADQFDAAFPGDALLRTATVQMEEMGLDATEGGRVRFDTDDRDAKQPRAFCVPVRVPDEVYLVMRPHGGHADYRTFWHELGHAMHYAAVDRGRPFHERWLGDNSVTEGFAMLWDHLTLDPAWLRRYTHLGQDGGTAERQRRDLVFEVSVAELYLLRRYAGKLRYELELHRGTYDDAALWERYAQYLTAATRLRFSPDDALIDVDPGFYAARYLRAWQLEASLAGVLTDRFDDDWYRNPRAGVFIRDLMQRGQSTPAHQLAGEIVGGPLSFGPAVDRLAAILA
jgi:hypothetical protein